MLSTVAVHGVRREVPADRDRIALPGLGWFHRCLDTLEADGHDTSLPGAEENAADFSRPGRHRDSGRWS
jgi:imidazoleglycerol phosphate synthase glutamine amidotransferase subunit HisH